MTIIQLISLSISVILIENLIVVKCFHMERAPWFSADTRRGLVSCLRMLGQMAIGMTAVLVCRSLLPQAPWKAPVTWSVFLLLTAATALLTMLRGRRRRETAVRGSLCGVNVALLGMWVLMAPGLQGLNAWQLLPAALGAVPVFVLTGLLLETLHRRLELCDCPRLLRGWPMEILTAALLLMAFMGFR